MSLTDLSDHLNRKDAARQLDRALDFGTDADLVKWVRTYGRPAIQALRDTPDSVDVEDAWSDFDRTRGEAEKAIAANVHKLRLCLHALEDVDCVDPKFCAAIEAVNDAVDELDEIDLGEDAA